MLSFKPRTSMSKVLTVLAKIAEGSEGNAATKFIKIEKVDDDRMKIMATDCNRCLVVTTHMVRGVPEGLYAVTKNKDGVYINPVVETANFPEITRVILKSWDVEYEIAACISKELSVYPIVINQTGNENKAFRFVQMVYVEDFVKLISIGYNSVNVKGRRDSCTPVMFEWTCAEFDVLYLVMPILTNTSDIMKKVTE